LAPSPKPGDLEYLIFIVLAVPLYSITAAFYYVPLVLVERSTGRSTFFSSSICVLFIFFTAAVVIETIQLTIGFPESPDLTTPDDEGH
jgi:hypothetical protein